MALNPKQAGTSAGIPRPVADRDVSQNFHQVMAELNRLNEDRVNSALPRFLWMDHVINPDGTVDVTIRIDDPANRAGTLRVWTNRNSYNSPDPESEFDGSLAIPVTPATILPSTTFTLNGGGTAALLNDIMVPAASGKRIFLEFVNEDGLSTGVQDFVLVGGGGVIDPDGTLGDGAISRRDQFIAGIQPVEVVEELPATCMANTIVVLATDGKLYRCDGSAWVPVVRAPDLSGVLTAEQIGNEILTTAKFAQGIRPVRLVTGLPPAGEVEGDTVYNTVDKMLYRWSGSSWTTSVKTSELTGLITGEQVLTRTLAADRIIANSLTAGEIAASAISTDELAANAVNAGRLAANSVYADAIQATAIRAVHLAANQIDVGHLTATVLSASWITTDHLLAGSIRAGVISVDHISGYTFAAPDNSAAIKFRGVAAGVYPRYIAFENTGGNYFIYANYGGVRTFSVQHDGAVYLKGHIEADSGTFAGQLVAATGSFAGNLTAPIVNVSGAIMLKGSFGPTDVGSNAAVVQWGESLPSVRQFRITVFSNTLYLQTRAGTGSWTTLESWTG